MIRNKRILIGSFCFLFILSFLVTGCSSVFSKPVLKSVDRSITLQDIQANPDRFVGKMVLLGGQIIATSVKKEETWVEVIEKPLDRKDKPKDTSVSHGRFLILFKGFMDPAIYSPGRKITVAGEVHGRKVLPIKEVAYSYPVIVPKEHHIWKYEEPDHGPWFSFGVGVGIH